MSERIQRFIIYGILTPLLWMDIYYFFRNLHDGSYWVSLIGIGGGVFGIYIFLSGQMDKAAFERRKEKYELKKRLLKEK